MPQVPQIRIQPLNQEPVNPKGKFVLYWMISNRRPSWNFSLDRSLEWAKDLGKPLLVLEPLRCDYPWASDRIHRFVLDGMADNARAFATSPVLYYPYIEPEPGAGKGLLRALAESAAMVVTDDTPAFFLSRMVDSAARQIGVRMERVDSNGLLPLRVADRVYPTAYSFRRFLQKKLPEHLFEKPRARPIVRLDIPRMRSLPKDVSRQWQPADPQLLGRDAAALGLIPIDHRVQPAPVRGGNLAAKAALKRFLTTRLASYAENHSHPDEDGTSGLSPYLHFGHLSAHEVAATLLKNENWSPDRLQQKSTGARSGWWGMSTSAESFLDELITWRELGFNMAWQHSDFEDYKSLPAWSLSTLAKHAGDPRPHLYRLEGFETARTHDALWNAAQRQLVKEGRIHNYLRMLWGKKILEWSSTPQKALSVMTELNNKYALDGRDPNSTSGFFWILGRYDRPWGPERPVFGTVRYMSSQNTARKLRVRKYLERYAPASDLIDS